MFKKLLNNYSAQTTTKLVRNSGDAATAQDGSKPTIELIDPFDGPELVEKYAAIAKDFIGYTAVVVGGTYCVCKIVGRLCR